VTLKGGDVEFSTPGTFEVKSATHNFLGGGSGPAELPALPQGKLNEPTKLLELRYAYPDLKPVVSAPFVVRFDDGTSRSGKLDTQGYARIENPPSAGQVFFGYDEREAHPRSPRQANAVQGHTPSSPEQAKSLLEQYAAAEDDHLLDNFFPDEIAAMGADTFDDLVSDYEYEPDEVPAEDSGGPGAHEESTMTRTNDEGGAA
jgi:hypothetical protein